MGDEASSLDSFLPFGKLLLGINKCEVCMVSLFLVGSLAKSFNNCSYAFDSIRNQRLSSLTTLGLNGNAPCNLLVMSYGVLIFFTNFKSFQ